MNRFAELYLRLDATTSSNAKVAAMTAYFSEAAPADAAWAVYFLAGGKPRQLVPVKALRELARRLTGLPDWLFDECYQAVGDLAETLSLLLPGGEGGADRGLAAWMEDALLPLRGRPPEEQLAALAGLVEALDRHARLVLFKLITGAFRVGVSRLLVTRALAAVAGLEPALVAQRLVGYTDTGARPGAEDYLGLLAPPAAADAPRDGRPYPFFLAHPLLLEPGESPARLGPVTDWLVEWKWDGIRAQLIRRQGESWLWSRGEELITERFPELAEPAAALPEGTVIDCEIAVWKDGRVQPFALLQQRIGRKSLGPKLLREAPAVLLAYDLLEWRGEDWRERPQRQRREALETLVAELAHPRLLLSPRLEGADWAALAALREESRQRGVEGLMLKQADARYGVGRTRAGGIWWKWKIDPHSVDAVLVYAQRGHGRRASLYTDYTFAVWSGPPEDPARELVPFAKAYSGLTDEEIRAVDAIVRATTRERFGPVRSLEPSLVFELGFEGIAPSRRHKSGVAVRFPRMLRWRRDKPVAEADTLALLRSLLAAPEPALSPAGGLGDNSLVDDED